MSITFGEKYYLHHLLKYVDFFGDYLYQQILLGFVGQYVFKIFMIFIFTEFKVSI